jgi:flagellar biosynthesis protein
MSASDRSIATAVALRYAHGDAAPVVVAKGRGLVAEEIIRRAHEAGVFVHESRDLVGLLMQVDLDRHIPPELFVAVAQLLAWIHRVDAKAASRLPAPALGRTEPQNANGNGASAEAAKETRSSHA